MFASYCWVLIPFGNCKNISFNGDHLSLSSVQIYSERWRRIILRTSNVLQTSLYSVNVMFCAIRP